MGCWESCGGNVKGGRFVFLKGRELGGYGEGRTVVRVSCAVGP